MKNLTSNKLENKKSKNKNNDSVYKFKLSNPFPPKSNSDSKALEVGGSYRSIVVPDLKQFVYLWISFHLSTNDTKHKTEKIAMF